MKLNAIIDTLTPAQINWLADMGITKYTYEDGKVNVQGDVDISNKKLKAIPVKFGVVSGHFNCYGNKLPSLAGAPREVGGNFYCFENKLPSLAGAPREVGGKFSCLDNFTSEPDHSFINIDGEFKWK